MQISLEVVIVDADEKSARLVASVFSMALSGSSTILISGPSQAIGQASIVTPAEALRRFSSGEANALLLDIFSVGVQTGLELIENTRKEAPEVPICLVGSAELLLSMPGVPPEWRRRFSHYFKFRKDFSRPASVVFDEAVRTVDELLHYLTVRSARTKVDELRTRLHEQRRPDPSAIDATLQEVQLALTSEATKPRPLELIPLDQTNLGALVTSTLEKAGASIAATVAVNKAILWLGASVVLGALVAAIITRSWELVTFGGVGMAGVIATLISNPLKSISLGARRLVQVQIAYLSFLAQLTLIREPRPGSKESANSPQQDLAAASRELVELLHKYF